MNTGMADHPTSSVRGRDTVEHLPLEALDYDLPDRLIATRPAEPRDSARLLVVRRSGDELEHRYVRDLPEYLRAGDLLIFNDSAVVPARFLGCRAETGARVEGLFVEELSDRAWRVMLKCNGRLHVADRVTFFDREGRAGAYHLKLVERCGAEWIGRLDGEATSTTEVLHEIGWTPLPPYIRCARNLQRMTVEDDLDRRWYQTVYANPGRCASVAAPTAGLHFTPELLQRIDARGVERQRVTLHVGPGTFKPIATPDIAEHQMDEEWCDVPPATLAALCRAKAQPGAHRIFAVGTTTVRAIESLPDRVPEDGEGQLAGKTGLFITPSRPFRHVQGMLTNFHLPRSTLLALVAAMVGLDRLLEIYREAVVREYRFYSYGDAMLILP